jgi:Cu(I)/Ag(I) efflux system membrane fusion protein
MTSAAVALSNVEILQAKKSEPQKTLKLYGSIQPNELRRHSQTAHIGGLREKLLVNFEGDQVRKGQILASIYSTELLVAQTEFLEILKQGQPVLTEAAKERLKLLKITEKQIFELEENGKVNPYISIFADAGGIVTAKKTEHGEYIDAGMVLFDITNLSSVWAIFDAYEADLPYLKTGDQIGYMVNALPGAVFTGRIEFISPIIDDMSRTAKVRLETSNKDLKLKPGMLATAIIHNAKAESGEAIILPRTAVLWTGQRSVVYIAKKLESGALSFTLREVLLGTTLGDYIKVLSGISEGEFVVASGVFAIDASAQLAGKKSMMTLIPPQQGDTMNAMTKLALALAVACTTSTAACDGHKAHQTAQTAAPQQVVERSVGAPMQSASISVNGACSMCKVRIENAAKSVPGVTLAEWNIGAKVLALQFDSGKTSLAAISKAVAAVGHDTEMDRAPDEVYNALHGCCKYRN